MATVRKKIPRKEADPTAPMIDKFESKKAEESKMVKGIFEFRDLPGGTLDFFHKKWKGEKIARYTLIDGEEYELPLSVVRKLNSECCTNQHSHLLGPDGKHIKTGKKQHRFAFKSNEYI